MGLYFAYGANMDRAHMARTAPTARPLGIASLADHRISIGKSGYGTVIPTPGHQVPGFLWHLEAADEAALDAFEGVAEGYYRKDHLQVTDSLGAIHGVMAYRATDDRAGEAHPDYLAQVVAAARALGFPDDYIREIGRLPTGPATTDRWTPPAERPTRPKAPAR